jgi:hypothetical protein
VNNNGLDDIGCTIVIESGSCKRKSTGRHCGKLAATEVTGSDEITDRPDLEADSPTKVSCNMSLHNSAEQRETALSVCYEHLTMHSFPSERVYNSTASYTLQSKQKRG